MITPEYCRKMARYNTWQNNGLRQLIPAMDKDALYRDRGAFFGSIMRTLNHLLWGDTLWMSRFDGGSGTDLTIEESFDMVPTPAVWAGERFRMDARISLWAESVHAVDLIGDLEWYSFAAAKQMSKSKAICVMHLFSHQTHHRGQVHAMLTAAGQKPHATDLPFIPEAT